MAAATTTYDIKVKYSLNDSASKGLTQMTRKANVLGKSLGRANKTLNRLAFVGVAAGAFAMTKFVKAGFSFNREMQKTQASMTTILQNTQGISRNLAGNRAKGLIADLKGLAKTSPATFQEMTAFAKEITPAITQAGGGVDEIKKLTSLGTTASSAFGIDKDVAARDIRQALTKGITSKDLLPTLLGIDPTEFNKIGSKAAKLQALQKALDTKAIREASEEFKTSFEGVFSTFKSNLQEFSGKALSGVFTALNSQLIKLNKWFDNNQDKVAEFATTLANGFTKLFNGISSVFSFILEHKDILLPIVGGLAAGKLAAGLGGILGAFTSGVGGGTKALLGLTAAAASFVAFMALRQQEKNIAAKAENNTFGLFAQDRAKDVLKEQGANFKNVVATLRAAKESKFLDARGAVDENKVTGHFLKTGEGSMPDRLDQAQEMIRAIEVASEQRLAFEAFERLRMAKAEANLRQQSIIATGLELVRIAQQGAAEATKKKSKNAGNKPMKVRMVVNVASDDPDRFAIGLEDFFQNQVHNPSAALGTAREG